jgi:hypothetical protein
MLDILLVALVTIMIPFVPLLAFAALGKLRRDRRYKTTDILRIYAERGQEPPQSVVNAITLAMTRPPVPPTPRTPKPPKTRGRHFSDVARDVVIAAGALGIAWWRAPGPGEDAGALMILAVVVALIVAADAVWHFVAALHTVDGK